MNWKFTGGLFVLYAGSQRLGLFRCVVMVPRVMQLRAAPSYLLRYTLTRQRGPTATSPALLRECRAALPGSCH
jgi:hypothetical protein